jgi:hypothetical protein
VPHRGDRSAGAKAKKILYFKADAAHRFPLHGRPWQDFFILTLDISLNPPSAYMRRPGNTPA